MTLNSFFSKIYCINLDRRADRWQDCVEEFKKQKMEVERFSATDWKTLELNEQYDPRYKANVANLVSVINVFKKAQELDLESFLLLEDDVAFSDKTLEWCEYMDVQEAFAYFMPKVPEDWQMIYLGGNHDQGLGSITEHVYRCARSVALHAVGFKKECYELVLYNLEYHLNRIKQLDYPYHYANVVCADVWIGNLHPVVPAYTFSRAIAWQRPDYSDIEQAPSDYGQLKYKHKPTRK